MAGTPHYTWRNLLPGLFALAVLVAAGLGVLLFARIGQLHGKRYRLVVLADEARGVIKGSDVWLDGQKVGVVAGLEFRPPTTDTLTRLRIPIEILSQYQPLIRRDSKVQIRSGGSLIGEPVVYITSGTPSSPVLRDGDAMPLSAQQVDLEALTSEFAIASRDFPTIINNFHSISGNASDVINRVGELKGGGIRIKPVIANVGELRERATRGNGTIARAMHDDELMTRAHRIMARADSLMAAIRAPTSIAMRAKQDSTLLRELHYATDELSIIQARIKSANGTAGRVLYDSAFTNEVAKVQRDVADLFVDLKKHPTRYISF